MLWPTEAPISIGQRISPDLEMKPSSEMLEPSKIELQGLCWHVYYVFIHIGHENIELKIAKKQNHHPRPCTPSKPPGEMLSMTQRCMSLPVVPLGASDAASPLGAANGARRKGRLVELAKLSAKMRCFKGAEAAKQRSGLAMFGVHGVQTATNKGLGLSSRTTPRHLLRSLRCLDPMG